MPICPPVSESFDVAVLNDSAFEPVPDGIMDQYETTRDYKIVHDKHVEYDDDGKLVPDEERRCKWDGIASLATKPTVFHCRPLQDKYRRLAKPDMTSLEQWEIFATHCEEITGMVDGFGNELDTSSWWKGSGDRKRVIDEVRKENGVGRIPSNVWMEVVNVIIHKGVAGGGDFFMPLGSWRISRQTREHEHRVSALLRLGASMKKTVSETPSS